MAKNYRISAGTRLVNWTFRQLTRLGLGAPYRHILTVKGRTTGQLHSTPVDVIEHGNSRWLVAGYGPANWVLNARAAQEVTLSRGGRSQKFTVEDPDPSEAIPVLRQYIRQIRPTRAYFDATADAPDDVIAAELQQHPVLRLRPDPRQDGQNH
jgi:deazaflavin-dependent oxidoreductase (nitroreductase family)